MIFLAFASPGGQARLRHLRGEERRYGGQVRGEAREVVVRRDSESGGRAALFDLRLDHGSRRRVLQVRELRNDERLRVDGNSNNTLLAI